MWEPRWNIWETCNNAKTGPSREQVYEAFAKVGNR